MQTACESLFWSVNSHYQGPYFLARFLIAHLFFKSLETIKKTKHLRRALSNLCLGTAENNYASVYETAMERIGNQRKQRQELAIEALMWITCAKKQLRVSELRCAICVEEDDSDVDEECLPEIEDIISACVGLVRIEENGYVHLLHQTTQTYFDQTKDKWFPNAEARIATLCITYLSYKIFECTNCNTDVGRCERDPDCEIELAATTSNNTFCYYAADNWGHHARAAVEIPSRAMEFLLDEAKMTASAQMIWDRRHDFELDIGAYGQDIPSQVTGLHLAAYFGLTEIVSRLLGQRQAVDIRDTMGNSPLIWAIIGSQAAAIELLLERGANANITDIFGDTALIHASREGALTAVQLLIEKALTSILQIKMIRLHSMPRRREVIRQLSSNFSPMELTSISRPSSMARLSTGPCYMITWELPEYLLKAVLESTFSQRILALLFAKQQIRAFGTLFDYSCRRMPI